MGNFTTNNQFREDDDITIDYKITIKNASNTDLVLNFSTDLILNLLIKFSTHNHFASVNDSTAENVFTVENNSQLHLRNAGV